VLPAAASVPDLLAENGRWMSRGQLRHRETRTEALATVLDELGYGIPHAGLAALRCWGQTGQRPDGWLCAADPVYIEARLDHVLVHSLDGNVLADDERRQLFEFLQRQAGDSQRQFRQIGGHGYLFGEPRFATAGRSAALLNRAEPGDDLPDGADAREHDRLTGELQLLLHDAEFNRHREEQGLPPVNSIWFWGGGAASQCDQALPPLFGSDALFRGYWQSVGAKHTPLPEQPDILPRGFVLILAGSECAESTTDRFLRALKRQLALGWIQHLTFVFADGWVLRLGRSQLYAFWRGRSWPNWPAST